MRRFLIVPILNDAAGRRPNVPAGTPFVWVANTANRVLIKTDVPNGTAATPQTIADVITDAEGTQVDVNAQALNAAQRTTLRTFLANNEIDPADIDDTDRKRALLWLARKLGGARLDLPLLLRGYDAA